MTLKLSYSFSIVCTNSASNLSPMMLAFHAGFKETVEIFKQFKEENNDEDENQDEDENMEEEFESNLSKSISCEKCLETFDRTCVFKRHSCHS